MSVQVSLEERVLVVRLEGRVTPEDVTTITGRLVAGAERSGAKIAVLAVVRGGVRIPDEEAKRAMRANRDAIRSAVAEVHVVLERGGVVGGLGMLFGKAAQWLRPGRALASFHRDETQARRALDAAGFGALASHES